MKKFIFTIIIFATILLALPALAAVSKVTLVKTKTSARVYAVINGKRELIKTPKDFAAAGYSWKNVKIITDKQMKVIPLVSNLAVTNIVPAKVAQPIVTKTNIVPAPVVISGGPTSNQSSVNQTVVNSNNNVSSPAAVNAYTRPSTIQIQELGAFDTSARMVAISNSGEALAFANVEPNTGIKIIILANGKKTVIPNALTALDINDKGQALFLGQLPGGIETLGFWQNGKTTLLKDFGKIPHNYIINEFTNNGVAKGVAYQQCGSAPEDTCPRPFEATVNGVKFVKTVEETQRAVTVPDAKLARLIKVNNNGQAIGRAVFINDKYGGNSFFWQNGQGTKLEGFDSVDINNLGEVVGNGSVGFEDFTDSEREALPFDIKMKVYQDQSAVYYKNGQAINLNHILPAGSNVVLTSAVGINDNGQIIAHGLYRGSDKYYFFLVSLPDNFSPAFQFTRHIKSIGLLNHQKFEDSVEGGLLTKEAVDKTYSIKWVSDDFNPTTVSIYYDTNNQGADGTLIVKDITQPAGHSQGLYIWNAKEVRKIIFKQNSNGDFVSATVSECKSIGSSIRSVKDGYSECTTAGDVYYLYAVISDGVTEPKVVYSKTPVQLSNASNYE